MLQAEADDGFAGGKVSDFVLDARTVDIHLEVSEEVRLDGIPMVVVKLEKFQFSEDYSWLLLKLEGEICDPKAKGKADSRLRFVI